MCRKGIQLVPSDRARLEAVEVQIARSNAWCFPSFAETIKSAAMPVFNITPLTFLTDSIYIRGRARKTGHGWSSWSKSKQLSVNSHEPKGKPVIDSVMICPKGESNPVSTIVKNQWYDLYLHASAPNGFDNLYMFQGITLHCLLVSHFWER